MTDEKSTKPQDVKTCLKQYAASNDSPDGYNHRGRVKEPRFAELGHSCTDIDLPFSACLGGECLRRDDCLRYELWIKVAQYRIGDTCLVPSAQSCNSFMQKKRNPVI